MTLLWWKITSLTESFRSGSMSASFWEKGPKRVKSLTWQQTNRTPTLSCDVFFRVLCQKLGTLFSLIACETLQILLLASVLQPQALLVEMTLEVALGGFQGSHRPYLRKEGKRYSRRTLNRSYSLCSFLWFRAYVGLQVGFLPKLFLHILTVFALGILIPRWFEGTDVFHGMSCGEWTNWEVNAGDWMECSIPQSFYPNKC